MSAGARYGNRGQLLAMLGALVGLGVLVTVPLTRGYGGVPDTDGSYAVGVEVPAGTYLSLTEGCRWEIFDFDLRRPRGRGASDERTGVSTVVLTPGDTKITVKGCGRWYRK